MTTGTADKQLTPEQAQDIRAWLETHDPSNIEGSGYQASIYRYSGPDGEFVIKEALGSCLRRRFSEASVRREAEVYARLRDVPGIPRCFGLLDNRYLILEYVPGDSYRRLEHEIEDRDRFFSSLLDTLNGMHEAGVAHGDLKRKDNILVGPGEQPFVIDFGIAILAGDRRGFLFETIKQADRNAWIKHKYQGRNDNLSAEDREIYRPMILETVARAVRVVWQRLTLRRWRKRNRVRR